MIDRSDSFKGDIYLLIKDKVNKNTYVVSVHLEVLEMVLPSAFNLKKINEDDSDGESKKSTET